MDSMIERVARAMWDRAHAQTPHSRFSSTSMVEQMWRDARSSYMDVARAAIAAMREPSDAMVKGGCDEAIYLLPEITALKGYAKQRVKMKLRWSAMIDAALKEGE